MITGSCKCRFVLSRKYDTCIDSFSWNKTRHVIVVQIPVDERQNLDSSITYFYINQQKMVFYHFNTFSTQPSTDNKQKTAEAIFLKLDN